MEGIIKELGDSYLFILYFHLYNEIFSDGSGNFLNNVLIMIYIFLKSSILIFQKYIDMTIIVKQTVVSKVNR